MKTVLPLLFLLLSSCALIERSQQARNENANTPSDRFSNNPGNQKPKMIVKRIYIDANKDSSNNSHYSEEITRLAYELGYNPQGTLSPMELKTIDNRKKVRELEKRLDSKKEREQYSKVLTLFNNDEERAEFLSIPSLEGRQTWINKNNLTARAKAPTPAMRDAMESQDISLSMPMDFVRKAWGEPNSVEVSGNPLYKNERWKYLRYVSTPDGYRAEKRFVYFESGKVVGWETE